MAQERPSTPEKQLLKLIEDPKEGDLSQKKIKHRSFSLFSLAALKGRFSFLLEGIQSGSFFKKGLLDIKGLSKILKACIVLLFLYLIGNFTMSAIRLKKVPEFVARNTRPSTEASLDKASQKKVSYYLEGPRGRNIFRFGDLDRAKEEEEKPEEVIPEVAPPVDETYSEADLLVEKLGLVGIGWSDDPDVMLKNTETDKMYFLKRGQRIDGLIKIEAIFQDRVILTYDDGKEKELR